MTMAYQGLKSGLPKGEKNGTHARWGLARLNRDGRRGASGGEGSRKESLGHVPIRRPGAGTSERQGPRKVPRPQPAGKGTYHRGIHRTFRKQPDDMCLSGDDAGRHGHHL